MPMTPEDKRKELQAVHKEIERCEVCHAKKIGKLVPGEGNVDARIMFVGEAPGKQEAESGRPFIGRSGKILRNELFEIGLTEEEVFITSAVKYLPESGTPSRAEIEHGRSHLFKQIEIIQPEIIVLLGRYACLSVLGENLAIAKEHGKVMQQEGRKYLIAYHPAAALHAMTAKGKLREDFLALKKVLRKP